jgi:hypothetical protein
MKCKIRVTKDVTDLFPRYQPKVGKIYDAEFSPQAEKSANGKWWAGKKEFCIVTMIDKRIVLRKGEYEIVRLLNSL